MRVIEQTLRLLKGLRLKNTTTPDVSKSGEALLAYDATNNYMQASENGGTYSRVPLLSNAAFALLMGTPTFTVGAEAADAINVAVQLKDSQGVNLAYSAVVQVWISATAGAVVAATPPSSTVVIGTEGTLISSRVAKTDLLIRTNATGAFDLTITEAGAKSYYVNVDVGQGQYFSQVATWV